MSEKSLARASAAMGYSEKLGFWKSALRNCGRYVPIMLSPEG
jgi:hypothetical protein